MILKDLGITLVNSPRAKAYLQILIKNKLMPNYAILLIDKDNTQIKKFPENNFLNINEPLLNTLKKNNIKYETVVAQSCNDESVISALKKRKEKYFIYTGGHIKKRDSELREKIYSCSPWYFALL